MGTFATHETRSDQEVIFEPLIIEPTEETPHVVFDPKGNRFMVSGKSYMEDVSAFYGPLLHWLRRYARAPLEHTVFNMAIEYLNTASSKMLHDIFDILEEMHMEGARVSVRWHHYEEDEDMEELGKEYSEIYEVPLEVVTIEDRGNRTMFEIE